MANEGLVPDCGKQFKMGKQPIKCIIMKYGNVSLGHIEAMLNKIGGQDGLDALLSGRMEVKITTHVIDCGEKTGYYLGYKPIKHIKGGRLVWDPQKIKLFVSDKQNKSSVSGNELRKTLKGHFALNVNVLEYLLRHPYLIPNEWKEKDIYFFGTIYSDGDLLMVRYLHFEEGYWQESYRQLYCAFNRKHPVLVYTS